MDWALIFLGAGQVGLLGAIFFRLGDLTRAISDHDRRIAGLEKGTRHELVV